MRWTFTEGDLDAALSTVRSLEKSELEVVFQPIVDLSSGKAFAHEALTRCKRHTFPNPGVLFSSASAEHAHGRLGRMIREVLFERSLGKPVFVNLHPEELSSRWLIRPDDPLNLQDGPVFLEITESAALDYFDLCRSVLREICARTGAKLVVDDLGAGYSNMMRIVDLEPSVVKLDIQLIKGLDQSKRKQLLVRNVVRLCEDLGAKVVAEGIETIDELRAAIDTGAHYGQGFLMAKPAWPFPAISWPL